jgi:hypothetical protein
MKTQVTRVCEGATARVSEVRYIALGIFLFLLKSVSCQSSWNWKEDFSG